MTGLLIDRTAKINEIMINNIGKKVEIITETGDLLVNILEDQDPNEEFYTIEVIRGDITDVEVFGKQEKINKKHIKEVKEVA